MLRARVRELLAQQPNLGRRALAKLLGIKPDGVLRRILSEVKCGAPDVTNTELEAASTPNASDETRYFQGDTGVISTRRTNVRTLEELLAYMAVDLTVWEVERHIVNKWEVGAKDGDKIVQVTPLYQVKAWLRRKQPTVRESAIAALLEKLRKRSVRVPVLPRRKPQYLLEISLFDSHFGLLAWGRETGEDYDLKIAEARYLNAVQDLLHKTAPYRPDRIVFPFGNDFLHINNPEGVTPAAHNVLDTDGRLCKVVEVAELSVIRTVELCSRVAPVTVLWIPGNHDPETSYFLCRVLQAHFRANRNVTVDVSPSPRKYFHYGVNLIGYTHGNEERHADLPTIMAGEQRAIWGTVKHCEWHVGHYHKRKETRYSAGDTFGGVGVRVIPSICGTDAWHFKKGYVNGSRVAEAYLYDYQSGLAAMFTSRDMRPAPQSIPRFDSPAK